MSQLTIYQHGMLDEGSHVFVQTSEIGMESRAPAPISDSDLRDFTTYLKNCTDSQVKGVYDKERAARRDMYVILVEQEAARRNIEL